MCFSSIVVTTTSMSTKTCWSPSLRQSTSRPQWVVETEALTAVTAWVCILKMAHCCKKWHLA